MDLLHSSTRDSRHLCHTLRDQRKSSLQTDVDQNRATAKSQHHRPRSSRKPRHHQEHKRASARHLLETHPTGLHRANHHFGIVDECHSMGTCVSVHRVPQCGIRSIWLELDNIIVDLYGHRHRSAFQHTAAFVGLACAAQQEMAEQKSRT